MNKRGEDVFWLTSSTSFPLLSQQLAAEKHSKEITILYSSRMVARIHTSSAVVFFVALLTAESRAFASTSITSSFSPHHKPLTANSIYSSNVQIDISNRRSHSTKQTVTQLRAGASSDNTIPPPKPPTNLQLFKFYFPCLALWISGPLLSLVDTSFIGLSAKAGAVGASGSAAQLAALGPLWIGFILYNS